jgi:hypothetical protein
MKMDTRVFADIDGLSAALEELLRIRSEAVRERGRLVIARKPESTPSQYPAARIRSPGGVVWFLDSAAAS